MDFYILQINLLQLNLPQFIQVWLFKFLTNLNLKLEGIWLFLGCCLGYLSTKHPPLYGRIRVRLGRRDWGRIAWISMPYRVHFSDDSRRMVGSFPNMFFFFLRFSDILSIFYWSWVGVAFFGPNESIHGAMDFNLQQRTVRWTSFRSRVFLLIWTTREPGMKKLGHWHPVKMTEATVKAMHFFCAIWHGNCREAKERIGFWGLLSFNILPMRNNQSWQSLSVVWHHATSW